MAARKKSAEKPTTVSSEETSTLRALVHTLTGAGFSETQDLKSSEPGVSAAVVLPDVVVDAVVEVEVFEVLELALGRGKHFFADLDMVIHRAADVEEE